MSKLLDIQGLRVHFDTLDGPVEALHSVTLSVNEGEIMGVVGESGCGKSVTSLVSIGLATCDVDDGSITFDDELIQKTPQRTRKNTFHLKYFSSFLHWALFYLYSGHSLSQYRFENLCCNVDCIFDMLRF